MNISNVNYASYDFYLNDLIKSLSNFCNKCPLKPNINVVKPLGKIYVYCGDEEIELTVDITKNKKVIIGELKKQLEDKYPVIYKKTIQNPSADDIRKSMSNGKTLEEALNESKITYEPLYKIIRVHDKYNEIDVCSLVDNGMYKFKCKIPIMGILEDLKYMGKESDALDSISMLYKLNVSE